MVTFFLPLPLTTPLFCQVRQIRAEILRLDLYHNANMLQIFLETTRRVSVNQPGPQGPDAVTTRRVSVTPPATLLGGWVPPTTRRASVTQPRPQGPDAATTRRISVTLTATLLRGWELFATRCVSAI